MIVVQMRQHEILHRAGLDAEERQRIDRAAQEISPTLRRNLGREAAIDCDDAAGATDQPDEIIHRHRRVMRIAADEML